jgi:RNA polymerase sigma-54 factor
MRFDYSQQMRLGQHMKLAPRMIQSMEILQMPLAELQERIEQELESNPTLEIAERVGDRATLDLHREDADRDARENERSLTVGEKSGEADFERLEAFEAANPDLASNEYSNEAASGSERVDFESLDRRSPRAIQADDAFDPIAAAADRSRSLSDQLLDQWHLADVDARTRQIGELLISALDERGSLQLRDEQHPEKAPLEIVLDRAPADVRTPPGGSPLTLEALESTLGLLQRWLEPAGIAARSPRESLLLQLDAIDAREGGPPITPLAPRAIARQLIETHLDDLARNRLPQIAERMRLTVDQVKQGLEFLRKLSLHPASQLIAEAPSIIVPDAIVEYDEEQDRYFAYMNDRRLPNLRLNREYAIMSKDKGFQKQGREFLKTNLSNAQWLIEAVQQRKRTLLNVLGEVLEAQREYFDYGPQAMKPLPMTGVAERLGIHVATVSRAVADKYIQTPRGVVPLRKFFTGGLATESGQDMSYDAVKAALGEVIVAEDKAAPLSDDAIVIELKKRGIEIARRTVAKYRDQLGIPTARMRKAF